MSNRPSLDDYVDVAERIQDFKDAHPNGSLQTLKWEVVTVNAIDKKANKPVERTFIVYHAAAYREPTDTLPGHGIAWEPFPGATPYTNDSELMNAETAAWGRAIVALGLVANRSLASRQEVRNRRADQDAEVAPLSTPRKDTVETSTDAPSRVDDAVLKQLREVFDASKHTDNELAWFLVSIGVETLPADPTQKDIGAAMRSLTLEQAFKLEALLKGEDEATPGSGEAS